MAATLQETAAFGLVPGRTEEIVVGEQKVGILGQVHPSVAAAFDIDQEVYLFELVVDELILLIEEVRGYQAASRYPAVVQDVALVVDRELPAAKVGAIIEEHELVRRAQLFDVFEGEHIPAGKRSLAFSVTYQAADHTLTDEEAAHAQRSILKRLSKELGAELRGSGEG